jgi:hypothetical protein
MGIYRLFPSTNGPDTPVGTTPFNFISGMTFFVTAEAWFQGYWWWVCGSTQFTTPVKCALWLIDYSGNPHLVPNSVVTSGTLTAGQWNWIPLPTPIALSLGGSPDYPSTSSPSDAAGGGQYVAAIGVNGPFPDTSNYWGSGQPGGNGITNGPLSAYSSGTGNLSMPYYNQGIFGNQGVFSTSGSDPSVTCPGSGSGTDNFWVDVQVSDYSAAPSGTSLRLWPSLPQPYGSPNADTGLTMSGTAFSLSQPCTLNKIWMFNPPGSTGFPTRVGIFSSSTHTEISGTDNSSPAWLDPGGGTASYGDGWIYVDYSTAGVTLAAGNYVVAFYNGDGLQIYTDTHNHFFSGTDPVTGVSVGGAAWNGISWGGGILTAPNAANGPTLNYVPTTYGSTGPGNSMYSSPSGSWICPNTFEATGDWGETRWADVEVTPASSSSSPPPSSPPPSSSAPPSPVNPGAFSVFFP